MVKSSSGSRGTPDRGRQSPPTIIRTQDGEFNVSTHEGRRRWTETVRQTKPAPTTLRVDRVDSVDVARSSSGARRVPNGIPSGPASMRTSVSRAPLQRAPLSLQMERDLCAEPMPEPEPEPGSVPPSKHETEPAGPRAAVAAVAAARSDPRSNHPGTAHRNRNVDDDDPTPRNYTNENASSSAGAPAAPNAPDAPGTPDASSSSPAPPPTIEYLQQRLADAVEHGYRRVFIAGRGWMSVRRLECECMNLAACFSSDDDDTSVATTPDVPIGLIPLDKRTLAEKHAEQAKQAGDTVHTEHTECYTDHQYTDQVVDRASSKASDRAQRARDYDVHPGGSTTHATGIAC